MLKINLYTIYRNLAGERSVNLDIEDGSSLSTVLTELFALHPKLEQEFLDENGAIREHVSMFIAGKEVYGTDGLETQLSNSDIIDIIPPVEGG